MDETARSSLVPVTAGMHRAMMRVPSDRVCKVCETGFPRYPGRYPAKCPKCGGEVVRRNEAGGMGLVGAPDGQSSALARCESAEAHLPVVAVSRVPRLQAVIEAAVDIDSEALSPSCSTARYLSYEIIEELVPGGVDGLRLFLEGPILENADRFFRIEAPDAPVLIFEFNAEASLLLIYATDDPVESLGFDPRADQGRVVRKRGGVGARQRTRGAQ